MMKRTETLAPAQQHHANTETYRMAGLAGAGMRREQPRVGGQLQYVPKDCLDNATAWAKVPPPAHNRRAPSMAAVMQRRQAAQAWSARECRQR
jgi:hypothetical protein